MVFGFFPDTGTKLSLFLPGGLPFLLPLPILRPFRNSEASIEKFFAGVFSELEVLSLSLKETRTGDMSNFPGEFWDRFFFGLPDCPPSVSLESFSEI